MPVEQKIIKGKCMQKHYEISYLQLKVSLAALERAELPPYLGSTLRGVIGQALLQTDREACAFLYENKNEDSSGVQITIKPYVIIPPKTCMPQTIIGQGQQLEFEILLIGTSVKYIDSLITALEQIYQFGLGAHRYRFCLSEIINSKEQRILWKQKKYSVSGVRADVIPCHELKNVTGVIVKICTPLRIRHGGRLIESIPFQTLIRNITKRVAELTERYGGWFDRGEVEMLLGLAGNVRTVREDLHLEHMKRYSNRSKEKMNIGGLMGEIEYEGDLTPFVPWLYIAQILHIGRNTTFGMGEIQVYFI